MSPVSKNSMLLVAGATAGFVAYVASRNKRVIADPVAKPQWEQKLGKVADLPWHTLHPALRLVNSSNLARGAEFVRALKARQDVEAPHVSTLAEETAPTPKPGSEVPPPLSEERFTLPEGAFELPEGAFEPLSKIIKSNPKLVSIIERGSEIGSQVASKYKEDEEFRKRVNDGATKAGDLLREARKSRTDKGS